MALERGNWAVGQTYVGSVKRVHRDGSLDVVLYARDGRVIGRESPALDGPKGYEPCCDPSGWRKIKKPNFPLMKNAYLEEVVEYA